ncbi:MAG TPA: hypothetical protein VFU02_04650 [Polyangiaceae bacterium]|nr:hypothetical protein [Polyangiaceae bacterium]
MTEFRFAWLALAISVGCKNPAVPPPGGPPPPPRATNAGQLPVSAGEPVDTFVAEMRRASDVNNFALAQDQLPPSDVVPFSRDAKKLPRDYARVVGYVVNYGRGSFVQRGVEQPGCGGAIAHDGTLCPTVVLPGVPLSASQAGRLEQLAGAAPAVPRTSSCASRAHHSFVFYDASGAPVFEYLLDLYCGRDSLTEWNLDSATRDGLSALCRDVGLGLCFLGDRQARNAAGDAFAKRYTEQLHGGATRLIPVPLDISRDRSLSSLTPAERRTLCAWNIEHSINWLEPGGELRQNEAGAQMRLESFVECTQHFPQCPASIDDVLPCLTEAQRGAPVFAPFSRAACVEQADCLWGFDFTTAAPPVSPGD